MLIDLAFEYSARNASLLDLLQAFRASRASQIDHATLSHIPQHLLTFFVNIQPLTAPRDDRFKCCEQETSAMASKFSVVQRSLGAACLALVTLNASYAEATLDTLAGTWSGSGSMKPSDGPREKVRCKVAYRVNRPGSSLGLDLRCASEAYKMVLSANIEQNGTALSGNWFESQYRQGGKISGTSVDGLIEARVEGDTVSALVTIRTKGNHQSFVMEAPGARVSQVAIQLNKDSK
jgi:hypothetical protein